MLEEPSGKEVTTPHVTSRSEAWAAFESSRLLKYTKIQAKLKKQASKDSKAFTDEVYKGKDGYFVFDLRYRRKEVSVEHIEHGRQWVKFEEWYGNPCKYRVNPEFVIERARQDYAFENGIHTGYDGRFDYLTLRNLGHDPFLSMKEFIFAETPHEFELSPEELMIRRAERDRGLGLWRMQQLTIKIQNAVYESKLKCRMKRLLSHDPVDLAQRGR